MSAVGAVGKPEAARLRESVTNVEPSYSCPRTAWRQQLGAGREETLGEANDRALLAEENEVVVSASAPTLRTLSDAASDVVFLVVGSGGVDGSGVWGRRAHLFPCMTSRRAQRQPRAGATWVRMLSITWVL